MQGEGDRHIKGRAAGCWRLGEMYKRGQGVPEDPERGMKLQNESCEIQWLKRCGPSAGP
jgi:TPR repeat protein